jgi:hypothetical protein
MRSEKILAINRMPDKVALKPIDIFWLERNETKVSASEAMKSRLLNGVTGGVGLGSFLRRKESFFIPGTGMPQM